MDGFDKLVIAGYAVLTIGTFIMLAAMIWSDSRKK
jgi:hypothetical protein